MATESDKEKVKQLLESGQIGTTIAVHDPKTGEVVSSYSSPQEAWRAGVIESPTLAGISQKNVAYKVGDSFTFQEPDDVEVNMDKKTGKITVTAPSFAVDHPAFKQSVANLETVAQNYLADPDYAYPHLDPEKQKAGETMTADDFIAILNSKDENETNSLANIAKQIRQSYEWRDNLAMDLTKKPDTPETQAQYDRRMARRAAIQALSPEDIMLANTVASGDKVEDTDLQAISDMKSAEWLRRASSYDAESGTAQIGNLREEAYNLTNSSDEERRTLQSDLERYFEYSDFSDPTEFAKNYATYRLLLDTDPSAEWWQGAGLIAEGILGGAGETFGELAKKLDNILPWSASNLTDVAMDAGFGLAGNILGKDPEEVKRPIVTYLANLTDTMKGGTGPLPEVNPDEFKFKDFAQAWWDETKDEFESQLSASSSAADTAREISSFLTKLALIMTTSNALSTAATKTLGRVADTAKLMSDAEAAYEVAMTMGKATPMLVKGFEVLNSLISPKTAATLFSAVSKIASSKLTSVPVSILADSLGEAIINQPEELMTLLLDSENLTPEARSELMWNVAGNAIGAGVAMTGSKLLYGIGKSKGGMAVSANMSRHINGLSVKIGNILDSIRLSLRGYENIDYLIANVKNAKKAERMTQQRALRELRQKIAESPSVKWLGVDKEKVLAQVDEVATLQRNLMAYERAMDSTARNGADIIGVWENSAKYTNWQSANKVLTGARDALLKAQKAAGRKLTKGVDGVTRLFTQDAANYIAATGHLEYVERWLKKNKGSADFEAYTKQKSELEGMIKKFKDNATDFELEAANEYIGALKEWSREWNDLLVMDGLRSGEEIASLRASGYFGDEGADYMFTMRKVGAPERYVANADGSIGIRTTSDIQHYAADASGDFVDPNVAIALAMRAEATTLNNIRQARVFLQAGLATVSYSSRELTVVKKAKPMMNKVKETGKLASKQVTEQLETGGAFIRFEGLGKNSKAGQALKKKAQTTGAKLKQDIFNLSDEQIDDLYAGTHGGDADVDTYLATNAAKDGDITDALDKNERRWMRERMATFADANPRFKLGKDGKPLLTLENYRLATSMDEGIGAGLKRVFCAGSDEIRRSPQLKKMAQGVDDNKKMFNRLTQYNEEMKAYEKWAGTFGINANEMDDAISSALDDVVESFLKEGSETNSAINALAEYYENADDLTRVWLAWGIVKDNAKEIGASVAKQFETYLRKNHPKMTNDETTKLVKDIESWTKKNLDARYSDLRFTMQDLAPELVNKDAIYDEVAELARDIEKDTQVDHLVSINDVNGERMLIKADPLLAKALTARAPATPLNGLQKFNYLVSKLYRMGTTGIAIKSMISQTFRDYGSAFLLGGAYRSYQQCADELVSVFGENVTMYLKQFDPPTQKILQEKALTEGRSLEAVMADEVLGIGRAQSPAATESEALRSARRNRQLQYQNGTTTRTNFDRASDAIEKVTDKVGKPNELRERHTRDLVYANSYTDAIKRGMSVEEAQTWAEYFMANATTNFNRTMVHLGGIQSTVPYLGAAVNGTKSFWRLVAIDPVGIFGRISSGLIVPTMALTVASMQTEENHKVWKNIPEYTKDDNICVVLNGSLYTIPIPQELSFAIAPFRQFVEGMYDTNRHAWWELATNDLIGMSPIDLSGFLSIDSYNNYSMGWQDRMGAGISRLWAQLAPAPAKSAMMVITGYDPYTGNKIDKSYTAIDPDTGQLITVDYKSGSTAKLIAQAFNSLGIEIPAPMAQAVLNNTFGQASVDIMDAISTWAQALTKDSDVSEWLSPLETLAERVVSPVYQEVYDRGELAWSSAIGELYEEKEKILMSDEWRAYQIALSSAQTVEEQQKLATTRKNIIDPFYEKVRQTIEGVRSEYGMNFSGTKFASVLSLMNTAVSTTDAGTYGDLLNKELYTAGKRSAIGTMVSLGFPSAEGESILGTIRVGSDGTTYVQYRNPIEILAMENSIWNAGNVHYASIKNIIETKGLDDERDAVYAQLKKATSTSQKNKIKEDWDKKLMVALSPYISQYGAEAALQSTKLMDYLDGYFLVPTTYMKYNGRSTYSPNLDSQKGFAEAFIKDMYGVNDQ